MSSAACSAPRLCGPHATRGPFRDESWCLAGVSRVGASRAARTCESRASRACDSRVSRSCEERLRTGDNQSPTTTSAIANQAARPISTHHHAFMPTSPCGQHPQHQVTRTRPPPSANRALFQGAGWAQNGASATIPAPRTLSSERPAPERGLCAICALPLGEPPARLARPNYTVRQIPGGPAGAREHAGALWPCRVAVGGR